VVITSLKNAIRSETAFTVLASFVAVSLFLSAGFISLSVILFFFYALLNADLAKSDLKEKCLLLLPILLFCLYVAGVLRSADYEEATSLVARKAPLLLFPLSFLLLRRTDSRVGKLETVLGLFLLACLFSSLICYFNAIINIIHYKGFSIITERKYYLFSFSYLTEPVGITPIYLGLLTNLAFVISLTTPFIKRNWVRWFISIYLFVFAMMISSKIEIIISILILITWLIAQTHRRARVLLILLIPSVLACVLLFPFLRERFITPLKFEYKQEYGHLWNSSSLRMAIWSCSLVAIEREPLFGYGTASGQKALESVYKEKEFQWGLSQQYNSHNEFLSTELDLGIPGLITLLAAISLGAYFSFNGNNYKAQAFVIIILLTFLVESALLRQRGIVFFSFFYSLFFWDTSGHRKMNA
jgi:O-antigen ligase